VVSVLGCHNVEIEGKLIACWEMLSLLPLLIDSNLVTTVSIFVREFLKSDLKCG